MQHSFNQFSITSISLDLMSLFFFITFPENQSIPMALLKLQFPIAASMSSLQNILSSVMIYPPLTSYMGAYYWILLVQHPGNGLFVICYSLFASLIRFSNKTPFSSFGPFPSLPFYSVLNRILSFCFICNLFPKPAHSFVFVQLGDSFSMSLVFPYLSRL